MKRLFKLASIMVFLLSSVVGSSVVSGTVSASPSTNLSDDFWPLPPYNNDFRQSINEGFWWSYKWTNGGAHHNACSSSTLNGKKMVISASYMQDYMFGDRPTNSYDYLSLNYFKEDKCLYWQPGDDKILRWYREPGDGDSGYVTSPVSVDGVNRFISGRGHSEWWPTPHESTVFKRYGLKPTTISIGKRYFGGGSSYAGGYKYTSDQGDNADFPNYALVSDDWANVDVVRSRDSNLRTQSNIDSAPLLHRYAGSEIDKQVAGSTDTINGAYETKFAMFMRKTTMKYNGNDVFYVGFSETGDTSDASGACEEWWFARGVGPIYLGVYHYSYWNGSSFDNRDFTLSQCKDLLAGTSGGDVNNPEQHFANRHGSLVGWLKLSDYCTASSKGFCRIEY